MKRSTKGRCKILIMKIVCFEEQLSVDGTLIIKVFSYIPQGQKKRFKNWKNQKKQAGVSRKKTGSVSGSMMIILMSMRICLRKQIHPLRHEFGSDRPGIRGS